MKTCERRLWFNGLRTRVWGWQFCISMFGYGIGFFKGEDWCVVELYKIIEDK